MMIRSNSVAVPALDKELMNSRVKFIYLQEATVTLASALVRTRSVSLSFSFHLSFCAFHVVNFMR